MALPPQERTYSIRLSPAPYPATLNTFEPSSLRMRGPTTHWWQVVWRWWILHPYPEMFPGCLALPACPLAQGLIKCDSLGV